MGGQPPGAGYHGNLRAPASTISPFATRQSVSVQHHQDHSRALFHVIPLSGGNRAAPIGVRHYASSRTRRYLCPWDETGAICECLKAVLVREKAKGNIGYLKVHNCWEARVKPAVNAELMAQHGITLFEMLPHGTCGLNEFLREIYCTNQSKWGIQNLQPKPRKKRSNTAAHAASTLYLSLTS